MKHVCYLHPQYFKVALLHEMFESKVKRLTLKQCIKHCIMPGFPKLGFRKVIHITYNQLLSRTDSNLQISTKYDMPIFAVSVVTLKKIISIQIVSGGVYKVGFLSAAPL